MQSLITMLLKVIAGLFLMWAAQSIWAQEVTPGPEANEVPESYISHIAEIPLLGAFEHTLEMSRGDVISVIAHDPTETVDVTLALLAEDGSVVAVNDDHEGDLDGLGATDAFIQGIEIEETQEYTIVVENNFYGSGEVLLYIILDAEFDISELFAPASDMASTPTPQIRIQERPQIRSVGPCTASVEFVTARLREAPSANAPQVASLPPGVSYLITGKVRGADSFTWYRLENYLWVRADAVIAAGNCSGVPSF